MISSSKQLYERSVPIYPLLFLSFFFAHIWSVNIDHHINPHRLVTPFFVSLGITLVAWAVAQFFLRNWHRSSFLIAVFIYVFFTYGHAYLKLHAIFAVRQYVVLILYAVLLTSGLLVLFIRKRSSFRWVTLYFNIATFILLCIPLGHLAIKSLMPEAPLKVPFRTSIDSIDSLAAQAHKPDIYFIVLDEYGREDILKEVINYDNSDFTHFLKENKFHIVEDSFSPYAYTISSLGSVLNFGYTHEIAEDEDELITATLDYLRHHRVGRFLRKIGYRYIVNETGFSLSQGHPMADILIDFEGAGELDMIFLSTTLLRIGFFSRFLYDEDWRRRHHFIFEAIAKTPFVEGPKFVFAHIMLPHPPFVFNENGGRPDAIKFGVELFADKRYEKLYPAQLTYTNKLVKKLITAILKNSKKEPIIILGSDHGIDVDGALWESPEIIHRRLANLFALRLPSDGKEILSSSDLSFMNIFPLIFNHYFNTNFRILDKKYFLDFDSEDCSEMADVHPCTDDMLEMIQKGGEEGGYFINVTEAIQAVEATRRANQGLRLH